MRCPTTACRQQAIKQLLLASCVLLMANSASAGTRNLQQATGTGQPAVVKVGKIPKIDYNVVPNCNSNYNTFNLGSGVYKPRLNKDYYDTQVPQRPAQPDELFSYLLTLCNYVASQSRTDGGEQLCCKAVDLYGDLEATALTWGVAVRGNDFSQVPFNRGVNFTSLNGTSQALLTNFEPFDVPTSIREEVCANAPDATQPFTCTGLNYEVTRSVSTAVTSAWQTGVRVAVTSETSVKIPEAYEGTTSITVGASFDFKTTRSEKLEQVKKETTTVSAVAQPGECFKIAMGDARDSATYQIRSRGVLAGPAFFYFSVSPTSQQSKSQYDGIVSGTALGQPFAWSKLYLKNKPTFKVPDPVGATSPILPSARTQGNWNAPGLTNKQLGAHLAGNGPNSAPADFLQKAIGNDDFDVARGDAVYIASVQDMVKYAYSIGFPKDEYHVSLADNGTYTKVDTIEIASYRGLGWTAPVPDPYKELRCNFPAKLAPSPVAARNPAPAKAPNPSPKDAPPASEDKPPSKDTPPSSETTTP